ncbi:MAG: hypothetical protein ACPG3W_03790 [Synechococcus sp.]|uniref:hypothetical protein n=1 Tax=Synechococcus sp. BMK-MC-1 TaxID=1442551 RepID=UPI00164410C9|nr:hypothetical protein [Synechococcus sp. BMK-MC-1]QNI66836.1 hypothetical protein SynBMKMC1_00748 [Synechococcus sp. BMK-MC-1]
MESSTPRDIPAHPVEGVSELIQQLEQDRAWLLEQIDRGRWADFRLDLAALERELGQLLRRAAEQRSTDP